MTDASYSHKFMSALAESLGWNPTDVQKALDEIAQLQKQTQELELSVQGKAPTNHASKQGVFGLADEQMYGHVKIAHEVSNDSTDGVAVSPDAVYAYAPERATTPVIPQSGGIRLKISAEDTSMFTSYAAYGDIQLYNGLVYTLNTVRVRLQSETWDQPVINPKLSLSAIVQIGTSAIDTVNFTNGVPSWPTYGNRLVTYIIPAYTIMPGSVYAQS